MDFSQDEIDEFKIEAYELLQIAESGLLSLDTGGNFINCFDSVFRSFHNLKGAAGMMEFEQLQGHTHELETIWTRLKDEQSISKGLVTFFCKGIDAARSMLANETVQFSYDISSMIENEVNSSQYLPSEKIIQGPYHLNESVLIEFFIDAEEQIESISNNMQKLDSGCFSAADVNELYRNVHSLKGSSYLFSFFTLGDLSHAMESSLEGVRNGTHQPSKILINLLFKSLEVLEAILSRCRVSGPDKSFTPVVDKLSQALNRAALSLEETELDQIGEALIETLPDLEILDCENKPLSINRVAHISPAIEKQVEPSNTIRVPVTLLDNLMTLMGEMVLVRNQVLQYSSSTEDQDFLRMSKRLNVVTNEIQDEMMKTRMQPIGSVLERFNRVVRDLSLELNKKIILTIKGSETELDKSVIEAIKDPLTHIVRNSCDHGIETPETRLKSGKSDKGNISIHAYHEGGQVIIEIIDDGKGLSREFLVKKAIEKGIINESCENELSDKEAFDLIFSPGFSTAEKVTNVSGRGVGMDVVRTNIEKIGGTVELTGKLGLGTKIRIKIPLTLAIIPALLIKCGGNRFAIPQTKLEELVRVDQNSANKVEKLHGNLVYRLRGNILPLLDLNKVLMTGSDIGELSQISSFNIVVLNSDNIFFGVIVDEILDTADIVVKPLNKLFKSQQVFSGATILGDGTISLIFDITGIARLADLKTSRSRELESIKKINEISDFVLLQLNSTSKHAIALALVQRLEVFSTSRIEFSGDQRIVRYRDTLLPLVCANKELNYPLSVAKEEISVVVIERAGQLFGIEVDAVLDTLSTTEEVKETVKKQNGIFGNISTADELIVVADPFALIRSYLGEVKNGEIIELELGASQNTLTESGRTVLLVEDTVFFRKAIQSVLEEKGFKVVIAENGAEALAVLESQKYIIDIIVSDIEMPIMNGFEMAKKIRNSKLFFQIPMLAISSKSDSEFRRKGKDAGFDIYLEKLKPDVLTAAVFELLRSVRLAA